MKYKKRYEKLIDVYLRELGGDEKNVESAIVDLIKQNVTEKMLNIDTSVTRIIILDGEQMDLRDKKMRELLEE